MAITISEVRQELQLTSEVLDDAAVQYAIDKIGTDDLDLVAAQTLRMVLSKYRGRTKLKIGKFEETIDLGDIRSQIRSYTAKSPTGNIDDGFTHPDPFFTRDGI